MPATTFPAFKVDPGEGRTPEPLNVFGASLTIKVSSRDTGGAFAVFEGITQPLAGPPLHVHHDQDEYWRVLEGTFRFVVDGREILAGPGADIFAPRGSVHTFQNIGDQPGRTLATVVPGGADLFFEEIARAVAPGAKPDPHALAPIFTKYNLSLAGPPLAPNKFPAPASNA